MQDDVALLLRAAFYARVARRAAEPLAVLRDVVTTFGGSPEGADGASLCLELAKRAAVRPRDDEGGRALRAAVNAAPAGGLRPSDGPTPAVVARSEEARALLDWVNAHEQDGIALNDGFTLFEVATREVSVSPRVRPDDDGFEPAERTFLIDYPLAEPIVFRESCILAFADLCDRIADAYATIYREPQRFGVWGHDRTDLVIERLYWYPEKSLVHPRIGS